MIRTKSNYGWKPDLPDHRDLSYTVLSKTMDKLPEMVDLREKLPPVYNQGSLKSCTANAIAAAIEYEFTKQDAKAALMPSRLFIYYNEREIENTVETDCGGQIRNGIKTIASIGVCTETLWPYIPGYFAKKPSAACYKEAIKHKAIKYKRVTQELKQIKGCLAEGFPVVVGLTVYSAFESSEVAQTGILNLPASDEKQLGGHAVLLVGYDDADKHFIMRNSWGDSWGINGYFRIPFEYLTNVGLSRDFWTIELVEEKN